MLLDLKRRGLAIAPELATGDGALGFWKALREVYGTTREQRCWVHKTANVLNKLPVRPATRQAAPTGHLDGRDPRGGREGLRLLPRGLWPQVRQSGGLPGQGPRRVARRYDFPAEHWKHIRTTNPIESTFATVRLRTTKTKGCLSRMTALTMVFKLCQSASKKWRRLDGSNQIADIIQGVKFKDGEKLTERAA